MADIDVLATKIDAMQKDLQEMRAELSPLVKLVERHDERITALTSWRNGLTLGFSGLAFGFLKTFFKF